VLLAQITQTFEEVQARQDGGQEKQAVPFRKVPTGHEEMQLVPYRM
jgi:hypothetical protein